MNKKETMQYEIAVFGAGPAGLSAAISSARRGHRVLLLDKNGYLGGNLTLGLPLLGYLDLDGRRIVGGLAQEYVERMEKRGSCLGHRACPKHNSVTIYKPEDFKLLAIEMCREAGVDVLLHSEIISVNKDGNKIKSAIAYGRGKTVEITADYFIDCTGDGNVAYLAGCSYELGTEGTGELQPPTVMYVLENVKLDLLFDYIEQHPEEMTYSASIDHRPGYDAPYFRRNANHVFVGLRQTFTRLREQGKCPVSRETLIYINSLNPGEVFINSTRMINTDTTDLLSLTKAELDGQLQTKELTEMLRENVPGFADCFISDIRPFIGIRESRRFKGRKYLVADDLLNGCIPDDTIALGGYKIDVHSGKDMTTRFKTVKEPFGIPYGVMLSSEVSNLMFAGRCVSTDKDTNASIRVMPQCMNMGEAAGVGVSLAVEKQCTLDAVNVQDIRNILLKQGAILSMDQVYVHPEDLQN